MNPTNKQVTPIQAMDYIQCKGRNCDQKFRCVRTEKPYEGTSAYANYDELAKPCTYFLPA